MISRDEIVTYLADYLHIGEFDDYCENGIQVEGSPEVERILFGVSSSQALFDKAVELDVQMIIVHHGLFWRSVSKAFKLTGPMKKRVETLIKNDITLCGYHLPLDAHSEIGNNAMLLKKMELPVSEPFEVGFISHLNSPISTDQLKQKLDNCLPEPSFQFGLHKKEIHSLAIVSGGAANLLEKASLAGMDAYISGEASEPGVRLAEELGMSVFSAGHYNSERLGPLALMETIKSKFPVECVFYDVPNPF